MGRRTVDREHAARVIVELLALDLPLTATLAEVLDVSHAKAQYILKIVREQGLLGTAPHFPARATINKRKTKEKNWLVCEHCTTHWPCPYAYPVATPETPRTGSENSDATTGRPRVCQRAARRR